MRGIKSFVSCRSASVFAVLFSKYTCKTFSCMPMKKIQVSNEYNSSSTHDYRIFIFISCSYHLFNIYLFIFIVAIVEFLPLTFLFLLLLFLLKCCRYFLKPS
uniref:Uncharacterized protein n=1 Tax=Sipha flava TaxID=143950 RepID=A0A2S2QP51_9HEMI